MCIITDVSTLVFDLGDDDGVFLSGVSRDLTERIFERTGNDGDTNGFGRIVEFERIESGLASHECDTATDNNAFLDSRACGVHCVFNACLLLFHFNFRRGTDVNDGDTTGEFCEAFLQFLAIVIGGRVFNLSADLVDASLNRFGCAFTFNNSGVVFVNNDAFGSAEVVRSDVFEINTEVFGDDASVCQDGDVFEHGFTPVTIAGCLHGGTPEYAANLVDDDGCEGFAFDIFGDNQ